MQVAVQAMDEKLGRIVTRVVLPRVVMHARYHYGVSNYFQPHVCVSYLYMQVNLFVNVFCALWSIDYGCHDQAFSENFTGLELEDGGGRGTSGIFFCRFSVFVIWRRIQCDRFCLNLPLFVLTYMPDIGDLECSSSGLSRACCDLYNHKIHHPRGSWCSLTGF